MMHDNGFLKVYKKPRAKLRDVLHCTCKPLERVTTMDSKNAVTKVTISRKPVTEQLVKTAQEPRRGTKSKQSHQLTVRFNATELSHHMMTILSK
mmetsp:Transcript_157245/g.301703  ORF Transcript_157245/g.301703 Transcript_157245/m.301703 type:complete len:94 (+) Transcript_157245:3-284(+)